LLGWSPWDKCYFSTIPRHEVGNIDFGVCEFTVGAAGGSQG